MPVARRALLVGLGVALAVATQARAEEYRLQVANVYRQSFAHYFSGPIGGGIGELAMPGLETALDSGDIPRSAVLGNRVFRYGWDDLNRAFGAVKVRASITPGGEGRHRWDEAVWQGTPGERSVWVIASLDTHSQQVYHTALKGSAPDAMLRYYVPYQVTGNPTPEPMVAYPLGFLRFYGDRGTLWSRYLSKSVSLSQGVAAIVGVNDNASFADWVYLIVEHPQQATAVKVVIGWDRRQIGEGPNVQIWSN